MPNSNIFKGKKKFHLPLFLQASQLCSLPLMHTCTCPNSFNILIRRAHTIMIYRRSELSVKNPDVHTVAHLPLCCIYGIQHMNLIVLDFKVSLFKTGFFCQFERDPHIPLKQHFPFSTATLITTSCDSLSCMPCLVLHNMWYTHISESRGTKSEVENCFWQFKSYYTLRLTFAPLCQWNNANQNSL